MMALVGLYFEYGCTALPFSFYIYYSIFHQSSVLDQSSSINTREASIDKPVIVTALVLTDEPRDSMRILRVFCLSSEHAKTCRCGIFHQHRLQENHVYVCSHYSKPCFVSFYDSACAEFKLWSHSFTYSFIHIFV